jgi:hypothetical protein
LTISEPVYPKSDDTELFTAQINRLLEEQIRRSPADWLWAHNRWKPLRPHFLFARNGRRVFFPPDLDRSTLDPFRILTVSPSSADDAAAAVPAIRAIKDGRPDTWLGVLSTSELADFWKDHGGIDFVVEWNRKESVFAIASKIRAAARFDVAIFFGTDWKPSLAVWNANIPLRVGRRSGWNSWLYNQHPVEPAQPMDPVRMNLHIAQSVGALVNPANEQHSAGLVQRASGPMLRRTPESLKAKSRRTECGPLATSIGGSGSTVE